MQLLRDVFAKNNLAAPQKGLAFRLEQHIVAEGVIGSTVVFESEHVAVTADEALAADRDLETRTAKEEGERLPCRHPGGGSAAREEDRGGGQGRRAIGGRAGHRPIQALPPGAVGTRDQASPSEGREGGGLGMGASGHL